MQTTLTPQNHTKLINYLSKYTDAPKSDIEKVISLLDIVEKEKGNTLMEQGEPIALCYFIVEGCVRQYQINDAGIETTVDFLCEHQAVAIFDLPGNQDKSPYSFECVSPCLLIKGDLTTEDTMTDLYPFLKDLIMNILQSFLSTRIDKTVQHLSKTPLERYKSLLSSHPQLSGMVPQHQIASYLGITPESLSRIKRRLSLDKQPNT